MDTIRIARIGDLWTALDRTGFTFDNATVQRLSAHLRTNRKARFGRFAIVLTH